MRLNFKQRLLGSFFLIFLLYTIAIVLIEQQQGKEYKTEALQSKLDTYAELVHKYVEEKQLEGESINEISTIINSMPEDIRITIISNDGKVLFDKNIENYSSLENHLDRIEIRGALYQDFGTNIRQSTSAKQEYLYYAKYFSKYFVRVALPYNVKTKNLLKADNYFIYTTITLFIFVLLLLIYAVNRFNTSILKLKQLTNKVRNHETLPSDMDFSDDELGDISKELVYILAQKEKSKQSIDTEREKLRQHFQYSELGLAFFDENFKKIYANTHFIQFANILTLKPNINIENIFSDDNFSEISDKVRNREKEENRFSTQLQKNGKTYSLKAIVYADNSFELTIKDISKLEKTRILKQEMTSNIAHELRTPVTALRGYLETLNNIELPQNKQKSFLEKAHSQSIRLSNLIEDVSLLSKIEEQETSYIFENVNMSQIIDNVRINAAEKLKENDTQLISTVKDSVNIKGNYNLLISTIENLVYNSLNYAGKSIEIHIDSYTEDENFYYFSYYDTGVGVSEEHISRLFERFYRIDSGRERSSGGSGLGLSIVKNAILLHRGDIQAKSHISGGLEYLFKLAK